MFHKFQYPLVAIAAASTLFVLAYTRSHIPVVSEILGIASVIFLPGYTLILALFPSPQWGRIEQTILAIGASLSQVILPPSPAHTRYSG